MKKYATLLFLCAVQLSTSAQWTQLNSGTTSFLTDVFFINKDTGFAVGNHYNASAGLLLKTTDGGLTWDSISYGVSDKIYGVCFPTEQIGFICGKGFISKTTDQGNTWTTVWNDGYFEYLKEIQFLDENVGYVLDLDDYLFLKTIDGGLTWTGLSLPFYGDKEFGFSFSSADTGMITDLGDEFELNVTYDGGESWTQSLNGSAYSDILACPTHIENDKWIALRFYNGVYAEITSDDGQSWLEYFMDSVSLQSNDYLPFKDVAFSTATNGWAVGFPYIIESHDGGYTWATNDTIPDSLNKVCFPTADVGYAVGNNGLILKYDASGSCFANFNLVADTIIPHHYWGVNTSMGISPLNYYWSWGDGSFDSIAYPSHTYADAGFYTICLTIHDSTGCTDSTCYSYELQKMSSSEAENTIVYVDIVSDIPTEVQIAEEPTQLLIFPNPVQDEVSVDISRFVNGASIRLYNIQGKMMEVTSTVVGTRVQINSSNMTDGLYTLQILDNKTGEIQVAKFVKSKQ